MAGVSLLVVWLAVRTCRKIAMRHGEKGPRFSGHILEVDEATALTSGHFEGTEEEDQLLDRNHSEKARMVLVRGWLGLLTT